MGGLKELIHQVHKPSLWDSMLKVAARLPPREERVGRDLFGHRAMEHLYRGLALSLRGEHERALRESARAVALYPVSYDALEGPLLLELVLPIYIAAGERGVR